MSLTESIQLNQLDLAAIDRLAESMVNRLPRHLVIGLVGTLGAGKTTLVQAIARAAGIDSSDVTSPTFTLLQSHRGRITLNHLDAYRLADEDEFLELGVDELFEDDQSWTLIEWADRFQSVLPTDALWIEIKIDDDGHRSVVFKTEHPSTRQALNQVADDLRPRS